MNERGRRGETRLAHYVHDLPGILFGFAREADDDVDGDLHAGHGGAGAAQYAGGLGGAVGATHRVQDMIETGLQREV